MTEIVITPPQVIEVTATSPTAYTITVTQPAAVTVTAALGNIGDMTKAVYDTDNDGVVNDSDSLGGVAAASYALQSDLHAAVTVADSASIDMTLTGQQVSAAAIFGTGAGVVAEGNHTHYSYYTLQWGISAGWNPVDSTTYYFGGNWLQNGTAARTRLYIPLGGTIVYASFNSFVGTTLGSAETSSAWVRLNNTTDTLISDVIQQDAAYEQFINSSLSIAVVAGDYVEIKWTSPAWTTNPTNTRQFGTIMVRV